MTQQQVPSSSNVSSNRSTSRSIIFFYFFKKKKSKVAKNLCKVCFLLFSDEKKAYLCLACGLWKLATVKMWTDSIKWDPLVKFSSLCKCGKWSLTQWLIWLLRFFINGHGQLSVHSYHILPNTTSLSEMGTVSIMTTYREELPQPIFSCLWQLTNLIVSCLSIKPLAPGFKPTTWQLNLQTCSPLTHNDLQATGLVKRHPRLVWHLQV